MPMAPSERFHSRVAKGFFQVEDDGVVVGRLDVIDEAVDRRLGAADFALQQGIESPFHVASGQRASVVKLHPVMQMKNVGQRIGNVPAFGQAGRDVQVGVAGEQVVEDEVVNALGLRVEANARIEVRRAALDDHDQSIGIGFAGAGDGIRAEAATEHRTLEYRRPRQSSVIPSEGGGALARRNESRDLLLACAPPLTHTRSSPGSPAVWLRWLTAHSTVCRFQVSNAIRAKAAASLASDGNPNSSEERIFNAQRAKFIGQHGQQSWIVGSAARHHDTRRNCLRRACTKRRNAHRRWSERSEPLQSRRRPACRRVRSVSRIAGRTRVRILRVPRFWAACGEKMARAELRQQRAQAPLRKPRFVRRDRRACRKVGR